MISWILIVLVVLGLFLFFKTTGVRFGKTWTYVMGVLIFFFIITFGYVITRPGIDVTSFEGFVSAIKSYVVFLGSIFDNAATITGDVVKTNWTGNVTG